MNLGRARGRSVQVFAKSPRKRKVAVTLVNMLVRTSRGRDKISVLKNFMYVPFLPFHHSLAKGMTTYSLKKNLFYIAQTTQIILKIQA
jgi:hypothetical protein